LFPVTATLHMCLLAVLQGVLPYVLMTQEGCSVTSQQGSSTNNKIRLKRQRHLALILIVVVLVAHLQGGCFFSSHETRHASPARKSVARSKTQRKAVVVLKKPDVVDEFTETTLTAISTLENLVSEVGLEELPEGLLQRCCISAHNNVKSAYARAKEIVAWRRQESIGLVLDKPSAVAAEHWYRKLLHYGLPGKDRKGRAVLIEAVGQWDMDALDRAAREKRSDMLQAHVVVCETLLKQAEQAVGVHAQQGKTEGATFEVVQRLRVPGFIAVLDMKGLSFNQNPMVYPAVLSVLKEVSKINAKYYPGAIEHIFIVNAPKVFMTIWRLMSSFVVPSSGCKVDVLPFGEFDMLLQECGPHCLPAQLGGSLPRDTPPYRS